MKKVYAKKITRVKLLTLIIAAICCMLIVAGCSVAYASTEAEERIPVTVEDPAFTLDGDEYPATITLQDFIDRGWKVDENKNHINYSGKWSEEKGVYDLVPDGFYLTRGESKIQVNLDVSYDLDTLQCPVRDVQVRGYQIDSLIVNGMEFSDITVEDVEDEWELYGSGIFSSYYYYSPVWSIDYLNINLNDETPYICILMNLDCWDPTYVYRPKTFHWSPVPEENIHVVDGSILDNIDWLYS